MKKTLTLLLLLCAVCLGAKAQTPFRAHRYDVFKSMPINNQSIVFVGNSITNMHPWVEAFGNDPRIVNRGNSGGTSSEILANVRSYCAGQPAKIFLMIGINDKPNGSNHATIVSNIQQTIATIKEVSPSTKIYLQSILPANFGGASPTYIAQCNSDLKQMLTDRGYSDVTYVDAYSQLIGKLDTDNTGVYSFDKLHTTATGYAIWTDYIKDYVGLTPVYPTEAETKARQQNGGNGGSWGARATYFSMFPIESDDVLFFGDEMVHGGEWHELLGNAHVKNRGTSWGYEGTNGWMNYTKNDVKATFATVEGVSKVCPKQVLLYTGTGEANGTGDMTTIVNYYKGIVSDIRGYAPTAKISLVSLMPTNTYNNSRVKEFNAALETYAGQTDNVEYIDIYSTLATNDVAKAAYFPNNDNMLHGNGYVAVANVLADYIDGCDPVTPEEATAYRKLVKGTNADEEFFEEGWYQIQVGDGTGYQNYHQQYKGKYLYANLHVSGNYTWAIGLTDNSADLKTYVYITGEHDKWHIEFNHGTADAYYAAANCLSAGSTPANLSFIPNADKTQWKIWGNNSQRWMGWDLAGASIGSTSTSGNTDYDNCYFTFTKAVPPTPISVTYTFNLDGKKIGEAVIPEVQGEAPTVAATLPAYAKIVSGLPATVTKNAYTLETAHQGLPFELGEKHRYYIDLWGASTRHYLLYANSSNNVVKETKQNQASATPASIADANKLDYMWTVGGDWFNGFNFKNSHGYYMKAPSATPSNSAAVQAVTEFDQALCSFDLFVRATSGKFSYRVHGSASDNYMAFAHTSDGNDKMGTNLSFYKDYSGGNLEATTFTYIDANADYVRLATPIVLTNPNPAGTSGLDGKYVATFSSPFFDVQLPAGVVAYTAEIEGSSVVFNELGSVVPAGTGVLLYAAAATSNIDDHATLFTGSAPTVGTNAFVPTDGTAIPEGSYILAKGSKGVGFYVIDPADRVVAKNKAYIPATAGSNLNAFRFDFEGTVTSIEGLWSNTLPAGSVFDLQGRRVQGAKSGLYIVNGKKVIR